jgi:hypothetical protein
LRKKLGCAICKPYNPTTLGICKTTKAKTSSGRDIT